MHLHSLSIFIIFPLEHYDMIEMYLWHVWDISADKEGPGVAWRGLAWQSLFHTFSYYERSDCVLTGMKSQPLCPDLHSLVCTSRFHQMRWCLWIWRQRRWNTSSTQSWLTMWCGTCASENVFASVRPFAPLKLNAEDISLLNRWDQQLLWVTKLDAALLIFWRSTFPTMVLELAPWVCIKHHTCDITWVHWWVAFAASSVLTLPYNRWHAIIQWAIMCAYMYIYIHIYLQPRWDT